MYILLLNAVDCIHRLAINIMVTKTPKTEFRWCRPSHYKRLTSTTLQTIKNKNLCGRDGRTIWVDFALRYAALSACRKVRMPSVRTEKYIRDASGWRKDVTDGNEYNDNGTDGQTDRQTDRQSATQYAAPPREEGRITTCNSYTPVPWGQN